MMKLIKFAYDFLLYGFAGLGFAFMLLYSWVWTIRRPYNSGITYAAMFFIAAFSAGILVGRRIHRDEVHARHPFQRQDWIS